MKTLRTLTLWSSFALCLTAFQNCRTEAFSIDTPPNTEYCFEKTSLSESCIIVEPTPLDLAFGSIPMREVGSLDFADAYGLVRLGDPSGYSVHVDFDRQSHSVKVNVKVSCAGGASVEAQSESRDLYYTLQNDLRKIRLNLGPFLQLEASESSRGLTVTLADGEQKPFVFDEWRASNEQPLLENADDLLKDLDQLAKPVVCGRPAQTE